MLGRAVWTLERGETSEVFTTDEELESLYQRLAKGVLVKLKVIDVVFSVSLFKYFSWCTIIKQLLILEKNMYKTGRKHQKLMTMVQILCGSR